MTSRGHVTWDGHFAGRSARACGRRIRVLVDQIRRSVSSVGRVFNPARHNYKLLDSTQPMDREPTSNSECRSSDCDEVDLVCVTTPNL